MARLPLIASVLALIAACCALYMLLRAGDLPPTPAEEPLPDVVRSEAPSRAVDERPRRGGVYAGVVLDVDGQPIHGARVLLIAYGAGDRTVPMGEGREVAIVGDHRVGGEAITDADGRFRIAADSQSYITRVLGYHTGYFLDVVEVKKPREDLRLTLPRGGRVLGTVLDEETKRPVPGAVVDIYLQQKVKKMPDAPEGASYPVVKRGRYETSYLATLGRFIPQVLGPRLYGLVDEGTESLRLRTDANGHFEIGPLGNSVQLEFVITHPKYKWIDFDTDEGKHAAQRTVVEPGETVEREFLLRKGEFIAGRVVDDTGRGVADVAVRVQSIYAVYKHWWYKHKWRSTRTDDQGRFRVEGLAIGAQQVRLIHPSFGSKYESAEAGTENLVIVAERLGALQGTVEGIARGLPGRKIQVVFESEAENPRGGRRKTERTGLSGTNTFQVERVLPGRYQVWVKAGAEASQPVAVEIEPYGATQAIFEMGGGGSVSVRVLDSAGVLVDPARARLLGMRGGQEREFGTFVSREGELSMDQVVPGTYRLRVSAPGRIPVTTEPFEVRAERHTPLAPVELLEWGFLQFGQPVDDSGRPAALTGDLIIEYRQGDKSYQRVYASNVNLPVKPGRVDIRARSGDLRYEGQVEAVEREVQQVRIVLTPR